MDKLILIRKNSHNQNMGYFLNVSKPNEITDTTIRGEIWHNFINKLYDNPCIQKYHGLDELDEEELNNFKTNLQNYKNTEEFNKKITDILTE